MPKKTKTARAAIIGEQIEVTDADNPTLKGLKGTATDETKNTITIKTENGYKKLVKDQITITIKDQEQKQKTINGKQLVGRTEARIKSR